MPNTATDTVDLKGFQIMAHATESLDGQQNAMDWLQMPSPNMGGKTPFEALVKADLKELQQLDDVLTALDYGMHS